MNHTMTHLSLNWRINQFKDTGEKSVFTKLLQLHLRSIFRPLMVGDLSDKEKYEALELLILMREKLS